LPRFKTGFLIAHGKQQTGYRNPAVVGRELRDELESGRWRTQAELASSLGVCMTLLKTLLALTRLDPIVEELFVSLGDPLPEERRLNHHRMNNVPSSTKACLPGMQTKDCLKVFLSKGVTVIGS